MPTDGPDPVEDSPAPLPEPPTDRADIRPLRPLRPGQLTPNWTTVFWLGWVLVAGGFAAVWYSARVTGMATWWLGPQAAPRSPLINILPFVVPITLTAMALTHRRFMPFWGILGAALTALVAWGDVGGPARYFVVEFALAAGGLLVSVASFGGMLRPASPEDVSPL